MWTVGSLTALDPIEKQTLHQNFQAALVNPGKGFGNMFRKARIAALKAEAHFLEEELKPTNEGFRNNVVEMWSELVASTGSDILQYMTETTYYRTRDNFLDAEAVQFFTFSRRDYSNRPLFVYRHTLGQQPFGQPVHSK